MAVLVYFDKLSEEGTSVRYVFGEDFEEMTRCLTIDKETRRSSPDDQNVDHLFLKAFWKISSIHDESGVWPERGMSAS
ncbi:hypothetical protein [Streptomyces megasporus]|uniref:hypothetical protein n=1 Tax=Streptomyces megasporus TaxID=44060 RepID=UPI0004E0B8F2|nr:hypothetical protein [Streptomyces megasporus]